MSITAEDELLAALNAGQRLINRAHTWLLIPPGADGPDEASPVVDGLLVDRLVTSGVLRVEIPYSYARAVLVHRDG